MDRLRIIFMGTAELACASLRALSEAVWAEVVGVVTQPDKPKGRQLEMHGSAVKELAVNLNLPVLQPTKARAPEFLERLRVLAPDLLVVVAYGQILPQALLDLPRYGCLNVHTSLLPKYRGAAPIQWAILDGEPETGVTIMKMDAGLDTGDILAQARTPIFETDTSATLHDRLAAIGAEILIQAIPDFTGGRIKPIPQPEGRTYARKIRKEDGRIDWGRSAIAVRNQVRALIPWPGAFTIFQADGQQRVLKIWEGEVESLQGKAGTIVAADKAGLVVACGENAFRITTLQREGGKRLSAREFLSGFPIKPGTQLLS